MILPGFNTLSEKVAESTTNPIATPHPFGIWFGDAVSDDLTHDLGADPNELVSIRIGANSTASNTFFNSCKRRLQANV